MGPRHRGGNNRSDHPSTPHNRDHRPRHDDEPTRPIPHPDRNDHDGNNPRRGNQHDGNPSRRNHDGGDAPSLGEKINDVLGKASDALDTAESIGENVKKLMQGDPMGAIGLVSDAGDLAKLLLPAAAPTPSSRSACTG